MPLTMGDAIVYIRGDRTPLEGDLAAAKANVVAGAGEIQSAADVMGQELEQAFDAGTSAAQEMAGAASAAGQSMSNAADSAGEVGEEMAKAGDKGGKAAQSLKQLFSFEKVLQIGRKAVQMFSESLTRLAEQGDKDAIALQASLERTGNNMQRAQDNIVRGLAPTLNTAASSFNTLTEKTTSFGQILAILDPRNSIEDLRDMGQAAQESAAMFGGIGGAVAEQLGTAAPTAVIMDDLARANREAGNAARAAAFDAAAFRAELDGQRQAAQDAAYALQDNELALYNYSQAFESSFSDAQEQALQGNVSAMFDLARGLRDAATTADDMGGKLPVDRVTTLQQQAQLARDAVASMSLTEADRQLLLSFLEEAEGHLAAAASEARNAAAATAAIGAAAGGGAPGGNEPIANAAGGTLWEPVVGVGQESGRTYIMGEAGPEAVTPLTRGANMGGPTSGGIAFYFYGPVYAQSPQQAQARGQDMAYALRMSLRAGGVL